VISDAHDFAPARSSSERAVCRRCGYRTVTPDRPPISSCAEFEVRERVLHQAVDSSQYDRRRRL
jgi:hypothetical protein